MMSVISTVAEFERDLLFERTHSGIARKKTAGKRFGHPSALNEQQLAVITPISAWVSISAISREFNTPGKQYSGLTVCYVREADIDNMLLDYICDFLDDSIYKTARLKLA